MDEEQTTSNCDFNPFIEDAEEVQTEVTNDQPQETQQLVVDQPEAVEERKTHPKFTFGGEELKEDKVVYESKYSRYKQAFLTQFIRRHIQVLGGPQSFSEERPYIFMDLYGGLGLYRDRSDDTLCAGSPILFYTKLEEAAVRYKGLVYEKNEARAEALTSSLYHVKDNVTVINDDNTNFVDGFKNALQGTRWADVHNGSFSDDYVQRREREIRGLIYLDHTGCCDVQKIVDVCKRSHMDVLIHHGNTIVKRCEGRAKNGDKWDGKSITSSAISNTHKFARRYWYTSDHQEAPFNKQQFNFLYGSNVHNQSPMHNDGRFNLYNVFDHDGQLIRLKLTHSNKTLKEDFNIN